MREQSIELMCAWWNCSLSPPIKKTKCRPMSDGFRLAIRNLIDRGVDILGLCEVGQEHAGALEVFLGREGFEAYGVIDLFSGGKSIDDFCLIYNMEKLEFKEYLGTANARDSKTGNWLKAGVFVHFEMTDGHSLYVGLSHWQSRLTYHENHPSRYDLGLTLRAKISEITDRDSDAHIILCGDYNDEPYNNSIVNGLGASRDIGFVKKRPHYFYNPFWECFASGSPNHPGGTYIHSARNKSSTGAVYDKIMFSGSFLGLWKFEEAGKIIGDIPISDLSVRWRDISDHYPIVSHLVRNGK